MPLCFKILNISVFDGAWGHTTLPFNFLNFGRFQIFQLYCLCKLDAIGEYSVSFFIQIISVEECFNKNWSKKIVQERYSTFIVCEMKLYMD